MGPHHQSGVLVGRYRQRSGGRFKKSVFAFGGVLHVDVATQVADYIILLIQSQQLLCAAHHKACADHFTVGQQVLVAHGDHLGTRLPGLLQLSLHPVQRFGLQYTLTAQGVHIHHQHPQLIAQRVHIAQGFLVPGAGSVVAEFRVYLIKLGRLQVFHRFVGLAGEAHRIAAVQVVVARYDQHRDVRFGDPAQLLGQIQMALLFPVQSQVAREDQRRRLLPDDLLHKGVGQLVDVGQCLAVTVQDGLFKACSVVVQLRRKIVQVRRQQNLCAPASMPDNPGHRQQHQQKHRYPCQHPPDSALFHIRFLLALLPVLSAKKAGPARKAGPAAITGFAMPDPPRGCAPVRA